MRLVTRLIRRLNRLKHRNNLREVNQRHARVIYL
jgi:hypothetical protein